MQRQRLETNFVGRKSNHMKKLVEEKNIDHCERLNEFDLINDFEKILSIRKQEEGLTKLAIETENSAVELE